MKRLRQIFKVSLAKIFFLANYAICAVVFDWKEFFEYLETPARINCHIPSKSSIDFSVYGFYGLSYGYGLLENFLYVIVIVCTLLLMALFYILVFPSIAITEITLQMLKGTFPLWCIETYDIIYIPIFAVINSFYWISLAIVIESIHTKYLEFKPPAQKPLNIFPD